jgi:hypothetical protein
LHGPRAHIAAWGLCLAVAGARPGLADLGGRAILSWQSYDAEDLKTDGLHQLYDLRFERDFTDTLRLRLTFRGEDDASGSTFLDERRSTDFRETQPGGRLTYRSGALQALGDWDRIRTRAGAGDGGSESERTLERSHASLIYRRENLPGLSIDGERRRAEDPASALDLTETRSTAGIDYAWQGLRIGVTHQTLELEDRGAGFGRQNRDLQGTLAFGGTWWHDRLALQVNTFASEGRTEERAFDGAAQVPNPLAIAGTFQTLDATPEDDRDQPLVASPALHDGNLTAAAGAALGPSAATDLNLAIDLGRFAPVDEVRIVARDGSGRPLATGGAIVWDLYASDDFVLWRRVTNGVSSRFDAGQSFWSVTFPQVTLRYLKVTTFFVNSVPTEVTELQAFFSTQLAPGQNVTTDTSFRSGSGSLTLRPHRSLTVTWWGLLNDSSQTSAERGELSTRDRDQRVALLWAPREWGNLEVQRQWRRARTTVDLAETVQQYATWTGYARWTPGPSLSSSLEFSRSEQDLENGRVEQERLLLHTYARFWEALDLTLDGGELRQDRITEEWSVRSPTLSGSMRGRLTRTLQWTVTVNLQQNRFEGNVPPGAELRESDRRWTSELFWRPSGRLGLGARMGRASGGETSGTLQTYQLQWQPFPGGAIALSTLYDQDLDPVNDRQSRRLILSPSWRINRSLVLNLNYLDLRTSQGPIELRTRSFFAALTLTF